MARKKMNRQKPPKSEEARQKKVRQWMGGFIIFIMVFSVFAFAISFLGGPSTGASYRFVDDMLMVKIGREEIPFYSYPGQGLFIPDEAVSLMKGARVLIVAFDPNDEVNAVYIEQVRWDLANYVDVPASALLLAPGGQYSYGVGGCEQSTELTPVIVMRNGTQSIVVEGSCIVIEGELTDFLLIRDQLIYAYYGVV